MVNASKILTVSYGTFSCTLEGFDDPFSTMKDISEYFRDLASEDRFFGAEPPKLDAEMLKHIAEVNTRGAVSAEMGHNAVTLRRAASPVVAPEIAEDIAPAAKIQEALDDSAAELVDTPAHEVDDNAAAEVAADTAFEEAALAEPEAQEPEAEHIDIAEDDAGETAEEDVAEDVTPEVEAEADAAPEEDAEPEFEAEADSALSLVDDSDAAPEEIEVAEIEEDAPEAFAEAAFADDAVAAALLEADDLDDMMDAPMMAGPLDANDVVVPISEIAADMNAAAAAPRPDEEATVADRLARIRAVVAQEADDEEASVFEETYSEDQHAEEISQSAEDTIAALLADDSLVSETSGNDDDALASMEEMFNDIDVEDETSAEEAYSVDDYEDMATDDDAYDVAAEDTAADDEAALAWSTADMDEIEEEIAPVDAAPAAPVVRAFVTRVRKTEVEIAVAEATDDAGADDTTILSDEDEADLQAELAQIEAEAAPRRAAALPPTATQDEDDLKRLFEATKTKFDGAETSRAHANISHLKAAVAARNADAPNADDTAGDETEAYREDLASAVKPHRPRLDAPADDATASDRVAPLVLVSEQRVDAGDTADSDDTAEMDHPIPQDQRADPEEAQSGKVLPRRVRRAMTESFESDHDTLASVAAAAGSEDAKGSDFEEFAAELGATDLVDILEAAAAYSQLVQGRDSFSRPKLLHLAMEADENFSREEGLRSFGQLLRNGTIKKIKRGSFELTRTSRYAEPASKRAAG